MLQPRRYAALRKFGNVTLIREEIYRMNTIGFVEALWQDLRHGLRSLRHSPGFTMTAVVTLTLGIGANTVIFSVVDTAIFKPLPYRDPEQLVEIMNVERRGTSTETRMIGMTREAVAEWRAQKHIFSGIESYIDPEEMVYGSDRSTTIHVGRISPGMPGLLGMSPRFGRAFREEEGRSGNETVVLLSEGFWIRNFGADEKVLGKPVRLDDRIYTVVGVMDGKFNVPPESRADAWIPLTDQPHRRGPGSSYVGTMARLRPGLSFEQGQRETRLAGASLGYENPSSEEKWDAELHRISTPWHFQRTKLPMLVLLGAVGFVLLIACANVANLILSRSATRQREIATRAALGASRSRLVGQFLVETLVLSSAGTLGALALGWWGVQAIPRILPRELPLFAVHDLALNGRVLAFTCVITIVSVLLSGLIPALNASGRLALDGLTGSHRSIGVTPYARRWHFIFQSLQITLALVLLSGAGLMFNSFLRMVRVEKGFETDNLGTVSIMLPSDDYPTRIQQQAFFDQLLRRVRSLPGVQSASFSNGVPPDPGLFGIFVTEETLPADAGRGSLAVFSVTPEYFSTIRIPLVMGRNFSTQDGPASQPVAIIDRQAAERYWPGGKALGKRFRTGPYGPLLTIVGVAAPVKTQSFDSERSFQAYVPLSQEESVPGGMLVTRTTFDPARVFPAIRSEVLALDRNALVLSTTTFDDLYGMTVMTPRFYLTLLASFAVVALLIAAVGIYGVLSYSVSRRTSEIGIRLAIGATPADIRQLIVRAMLGPVATGTLLGIMGSFWLTRFLRSLLYQVEPSDPLTFGAAVTMMLLVALIASCVPSRKASRLDPTAALRAE